MRVGVTGPLHPDSLADNILTCLADLDVTPVPLGPVGPMSTGRFRSVAAELLPRFGAEAEQFGQRSLVKRARAAGCDVIINIFQALTADTVRAMRAGGSRVCLWFPDHVANVGRMSLVEAEYDALFLKDQLFARRLNDVYGLPAHYVPEACNPHWHKPIGEAGVDEHIVVVGNLYPTRAKLLMRLHEAGVPLSLYGSGFPRWFEPGSLAPLHTGQVVYREDKARVFRQARGVLNNLHPAEMSSVNCRLFEAAASGGAVLCERRDALAELFEDDTEVLGFESFEELLTHCQTLLGDPALGRRIGDAASARALAEHTFQIRLRQILEIVG